MRHVAALVGMAWVAITVACAAPSASVDSSGDLKSGSSFDRQVARMTFPHAQGYVALEVLDDDLVHVQYGTGEGPSENERLPTTVMVAKTDYPGPTYIARDGTRIETAELIVDADPEGCLDITRRTTGAWLLAVCPEQLSASWKGFRVDGSQMDAAYGLGQLFLRVGSADGNWLQHGRFGTDGYFGHHFRSFHGGASSQVQLPMLYALGYSGPLGLFLDDERNQNWDMLNPDSWEVRTSSDEVSFFIMGGDSLLDLRGDYMELTGRPPVPPRKAFGLWISQFGFKSWDEVDQKIAGLREGGFPMDGFLLDIDWFGGTVPHSPDSAMGSLSWDTGSFPSPGSRIAEYADDHIGVIAIEESYVARNQPAYRQLGDMDPPGLVQSCDTGGPVDISEWMGRVGMIDWTHTDAAAFWHDEYRHPNLVDEGVLGHWTDLGEPERFDGAAVYQGIEPGRCQHADVHNLYNLVWHKSIYEGYRRRSPDRRLFLMSRAGTSGVQRYGAGMWSGDLASRLDVLATHQNVAMHMSFAGIDYYSSDTGGFWRRELGRDTAVSPGGWANQDELYTQWFANAAWFDIPLRPHVYNCGFANEQDPGCPYEVSPAGIGNVPSNLANLRQRYELIPYYYSLAHRAYLYGEPVIAPVVMHFEDDAEVWSLGSQRMIGRDLLVGVVASHGQRTRDGFYLPRGTWVGYHTHDRIHSDGMYVDGLSLKHDDIFRLPVFARAGTILPMMHVDEQTRDAYGHREDASGDDLLVLKVFPHDAVTSFTLYEDDGATVDDYDGGGRPLYDTRTTELSQVLCDTELTVRIGAASGDYSGAPSRRNNELRVVAFDDWQPTHVSVDGDTMPRLTSRRIGGAQMGWTFEDGIIRIRTGRMPVDVEKVIVVSVERIGVE